MAPELGYKYIDYLVSVQRTTRRINSGGGKERCFRGGKEKEEKKEERN